MPSETTPPEQGGDDVPKEGEQNSENVEEGDKAPTAIEAATALAERIDAGNKLSLEILERQEKLAAQNMLGGSSSAGQAPPEKKELTDEEYAEKVMAGETPELPKKE